MFSENSRYVNLSTKSFTRSDGVEVRYVSRRFVPRPEDLTFAGFETVGPAERPDHVAHRAYGEAESFWRLADAQLSFDASDLTRAPGQQLRVPMVMPE